MADLLSSLIVPSSPVATTPPKESPHGAATGPSEEPPSGSDEAALHADNLVIHDVDAYLNDPKNQALMATIKKNPNTYPATKPVQLGGQKSTYHVSTLYHLCQGRNLVPQFEIEVQADGRFGGSLRIGSETVHTDEGFLTKKDAKEALAEKGVKLVKGMVSQGNGPGADEGSKNWIGLLQEYHVAPGSETGGVGANYTEFALGSCFACICTIPGHDAEFGSKNTAFPSKKAARNDAAKQAVQHLIAQDLLNPDGSVKIRKKGSPSKFVKVVEGKGLEVKMDATYAQKVTNICPILGLSPPTYRFVPTSDAAPNYLSGAAYFTGHPLFPGPIGEFRNVYGKKNAKEECARGVWQVLRKLAKERGVEVEISSEEDEDGHQ